MKFKLQMILYGIVIVILILAFIFVNVYKNLQTKQDGYCQAPTDCEGLVHIECVGSWACASNQCAWKCTANETQGSAGAGGLSGSTVECVDDSNCPLGTCADGYKYQKSACMNYKCMDLNFFADPCMGHY